MGPALKGRIVLPILLVAAFTVSCARDPEVAKREYVESGDRFLREKKVKEAIVQYRNALKQDPRFGEARFRLAEAYVQDGDWRRAGREYIRAADLLPKDVEAQLKAGRVLLFARQFQDAATRAHNALALDRRNVDAQVLLGNALAGLRDVDGAIEEIQEAIRLDPNNALGYVSLGALEHAAGRQTDAEAAFRKAIEADPKSTAAYLGLANFYWSNQPRGGRGAYARARPRDRPRRFPHQSHAGALSHRRRQAGRRRAVSDEARQPVEGRRRTTGARRLLPGLEPHGQGACRCCRRSPRPLRAARPNCGSRGSTSAQGRRDAARQRLDALLGREPSNAAGARAAGRAPRRGRQAGRRREPAAGRRRRQSRRSRKPSSRSAARMSPATIATRRCGPSTRRCGSIRARPPRRWSSHASSSPAAVPTAPSSLPSRRSRTRRAIPTRNWRSFVRCSRNATFGAPRASCRSLTGAYPNHAAVQTQAGILAGLKGDRAAADRLLTRALELDQNNNETLERARSRSTSRRRTTEAAIRRVEARLARTPKDAGRAAARGGRLRARRRRAAGRTVAADDDRGGRRRTSRPTTSWAGCICRSSVWTKRWRSSTRWRNGTRAPCRR